MVGWLGLVNSPRRKAPQSAPEATGGFCLAGRGVSVYANSMDAQREVVAVDPTDPRLGINAAGELVLCTHTPYGPLAVAVGKANEQGWIHFVTIG